MIYRIDDDAHSDCPEQPDSFVTGFVQRRPPALNGGPSFVGSDSVEVLHIDHRADVYRT